MFFLPLRPLRGDAPRGQPYVASFLFRLGWGDLAASLRVLCSEMPQVSQNYFEFSQIQNTATYPLWLCRDRGFGSGRGRGRFLFFGGMIFPGGLFLWSEWVFKEKGGYL